MKSKVMNGRAPSLSLFLMVLLASCGGGATSSLQVFTDDIEASGAPLNLGTINAQPVTLQFDDTYADDETLYAYMPLNVNTQNRSRLGGEDDDYIIVFMESGEGEFAEDATVFSFKTTINVNDGSAADLSDIVNIEGNATTLQQQLAQDFVDFVAEESKDFIDAFTSANDQTENSIVSKLENIGYEFQTYDQESYDYYENQLNNKYQLNIEVKKLYQGYVNDDEGWTQIIVLGSAEQATKVYYARLYDESETGYYYRSNQVVVYTSSQTAYQALLS